MKAFNNIRMKKGSQKIRFSVTYYSKLYRQQRDRHRSFQRYVDRILDSTVSDFMLLIFIRIKYFIMVSFNVIRKFIFITLITYLDLTDKTLEHSCVQ